MKWEKLGIIYKPNTALRWKKSHAMVPTPIQIDSNTIRVYVTHQDHTGIGRVGFVEFDSSDLTVIKNESILPTLDIGENGTFDENGVIACSIVKISSKIYYMYYVGFEIGQKIRYRLLTGLAISNDCGVTFQRYSKTPILERSDSEPFFRGGPYCIKEGNRFRMWYCGGSSWIQINGKRMPEYEIKYIESEDGINWPTTGSTQISVASESEYGFGRPAILRLSSTCYFMYYSIRDKKSGEYRLGLANSVNGLDWARCDSELHLTPGPATYDAKAIMYATPILINSNLFVFYNGNNFGEEGIALARQIS